MTAATLAEHFPERVWDRHIGPAAVYVYERTREVRCACGWVTDAPEALTAKRWAEHVLERTAA